MNAATPAADAALARLELTAADLAAADAAERVRAAYLRLSKLHHPDKGGDVEAFKAIKAAAEEVDARLDGASAAPAVAPPSWQVFAAAAAVVKPTTRIERAVGAAKCYAAGCDLGGAVAVGALRVGGLLPQTGSYGRWKHLACAKVPAAVHTKLASTVPNGVDPLDDPAAVDGALETLETLEGATLEGFTDLDPPDRKRVALWAVQQAHHAKVVARPTAEPTTALAAARDAPAFVAPEPGSADGVADCLRGVSVVLTGTFPFVAGGVGLGQGKDGLKKLIERFGGKVTGSVSKKTGLLLVGKEPGGSKLSAASAHGVKKADAATLLAILKRGRVHPAPGEPEDPDVVVEALSGGFGAKAGRAIGAEEAAALGLSGGGAKRLKCAEA